MSHRHTKAAAASIATNFKNDLKTGRTDLPQLILERQLHQKDKRSEDMIGNHTNHKQEGHHKHRGERRSDPTPVRLSPGDPLWEHASL